MTIKFDCPNCLRKLSVKDELAGKKGKCPGCQKNVLIPAATTQRTANPAATPARTPEPAEPPLPPLPPPPSVDGPERSQEEIDAAAMDALFEKPAEDAPPDEITFDCPMCGEKMTVSAELAGKREQCRECRRIVKVPNLEEKKPKDWREMDRQAPPPPTGEGTPEDQLGATTTTGVSQEGKEEFDLIPRREKPIPFGDRVLPYVLNSLIGLLVLGLTWGALGWWSTGYEQQLFATVTAAMEGEAGKKLGREGVAALRIGMAEYHFRRKAADSAEKGRAQLEAALAGVSAGSGHGDKERDLVLIDLAHAVLDHAAEKADPAVERGEKLSLDEAQKILVGAFRSMSIPEAKQEAIRQIGRRLLAMGYPERALALASLSSSTPADRAEAQAIVGLALFATDRKEMATQAVNLALEPFGGSDRPLVGVAVLVLAELTGRPAPEVRTGLLDEKNNGTVARAEVLARSGKLDEARAQAASVQHNDKVRLRSLIAIAAVGEAPDIDAAVRQLEALRRDPNLSAWLPYRLVQIAAEARLSAERLRAIAGLVNDRDLRARAGLLALRQELASATGVLPAPGAEVEKLDAKSVGRLLALEFLCRHNTTMNSSWGNDIQGWEEPARAFGALGILQGRHAP